MKEALERARGFVCEVIPESDTPLFAGHNVPFDIRFISAKERVHGITSEGEPGAPPTLFGRRYDRVMNTLRMVTWAPPGVPLPHGGRALGNFLSTTTGKPISTIGGDDVDAHDALADSLAVAVAALSGDRPNVGACCTDLGPPHITVLTAGLRAATNATFSYLSNLLHSKPKISTRTVG